MKKPVMKYKVFIRTERDYAGNGVNQNTRQFVGYQFAVSAAQAVSRFAYRTGSSKFSMYDMFGDGLCIHSLEAELD